MTNLVTRFELVYITKRAAEHGQWNGCISNAVIVFFLTFYILGEYVTELDFINTPSKRNFLCSCVSLRPQRYRSESPISVILSSVKAWSSRGVSHPPLTWFAPV